MVQFVHFIVKKLKSDNATVVYGEHSVLSTIMHPIIII